MTSCPFLQFDVFVLLVSSDAVQNCSVHSRSVDDSSSVYRHLGLLFRWRVSPEVKTSISRSSTAGTVRLHWYGSRRLSLCKSLSDLSLVQLLWCEVFNSSIRTTCFLCLIWSSSLKYGSNVKYQKRKKWINDDILRYKKLTRDLLMIVNQSFDDQK